MVPTYLFLAAVNVTSEPVPAGCDVALFARAALRNPCGVDQISIVRSSTAAGCACGAEAVPGAAPAGAAMFHAAVPLMYWSTFCSTGAGRARPASTTCIRV